VNVHVKGSLRNGVRVELASHHEGYLGRGEYGADKDNLLDLGLLDEGKERAGDAERSDAAEGDLIGEFVKVAVIKGHEKRHSEEERNKNVQLLERGVGLRVLASVVDEVVESVGKERGGSRNSLVDALLVTDVELDDLDVGVLRGESLELGCVKAASSGDDHVGLVLGLFDNNKSRFSP
jgi:hypothetical protein